MVAAALGFAAAAALGEIGLRLLGLGAPVLYDNRSAYGYRPLPDQTRRRLRGARIHIDGFGLRGPDVAAARPPDALRVLFFGDSVTYGGSHVDDQQLFSAVATHLARDRLADRYRTAEPLNAGVNAWGPQNILGLLEGDILPAGLGSQAWVLTVLDDDFRRDKTRIDEVPYFNVAPWSAWEELLVLGAYKIVTAYKRPRPAADLAALATANLTAYRAILEQGRAGGARVLLVWHPTAPAVTGPAEPHKQALLAMAEDAGFPVLDLTAAYRAASGAHPLYADGMHLSVAGHAVAGQAIGEALVTLLRSETASRVGTGNETVGPHTCRLQSQIHAPESLPRRLRRPRHAVGLLHRAAFSPSVPDPRRSLGSAT